MFTATVTLHVAEELRGATGWQLATHVLLLSRATLHEVEPSPTIRNNRSTLQPPFYSVTPLQQLATQFFPLPQIFAAQIAISCSDRIARCNISPRQLQQQHFSTFLMLLRKLHRITASILKFICRSNVHNMPNSPCLLPWAKSLAGKMTINRNSCRLRLSYAPRCDECTSSLS